MSTPSPDRIKAFLDDMALLCLKHGICLIEESCGYECWFEVMELNETFGGFTVSTGDIFGVFGAGAEFADVDQKHTAARSVDVSTLTAHRRIALTRSLARVEA